MSTRLRLSHPFSTTSLAACLTLALSLVFAAEKSFPTGTYAAEGHKVTIAFDDKGQFRVNESEVTQVTGQYTSKGSQLEITDAQGPWACTKSGEQSGTYMWKYADSALTFSKVKDLCQDRVSSLTQVKWKRQP